MQARFELLLIVSSIVLFASCKKSNTQGRFIPASASVAIQIDADAMSKKLPWSVIKENPIFKQAYGDSSLPETLKKILDNPETAGIDVTKDLLFFVQKDTLGGYIAFEGSVKDEAAFKNFNNSFPEKGSASEADGISFISRMPVCVGWNKDKFIYVIDAPQLGRMDDFSRRMMTDSIDISNHGMPRDIGATCKAVFALKEGNSLADEEKFTALMAETGDVHFWFNTEELSKSGNTSPIQMITLDKFTKGSVTAGTVVFNDGKIDISTLSYFGADISKVFKKYSDGKVNEDMLKHIPGNNVLAAMALNCNPEGVKELLQVLGFDGFANAALTKMGSGINDFVKGSKGDVVLALSDLTMVTDTAASGEGIGTFTKPNFNFLFATSVADKASFNKLINAGKTISGSFMKTDSSNTLAYSSNDQYFVLGNTKAQADKYLAGNNTEAPFIKTITGEPFGAYINTQAMVKTLQQQTAGDSVAKIVYEASLLFWDNILWKGGTFKNGGLAQHIEVNLVDKKANSLLQINHYAARLDAARVIKLKKQKEDIMAYEDAVNPAEIKPKTK